jgi:hypothetical protein
MSMGRDTSAGTSLPLDSQRRGKSRAGGRRPPHYSLVTAVPELRNDGIILNAQRQRGRGARRR